MALIGECRGWHMETELLSCWKEYRAMFHHIPSQSRFNSLDLSMDRQCSIDSLPTPVVQFHLVPGSTGDWRAFGATFGKVVTKKQTIFGYRLHLLITLGGLILDFEMTPANATDAGSWF